MNYVVKNILILTITGVFSPLFSEGQVYIHDPIAQAPKAQQSSNKTADVGDIKAKDYNHLLGMEGFNDNLLNMHFKLYQGYVKNSNLLLSLLKSSDPTQFGALKRHLGWEYNGVILHELYFENLGGKTILSSGDPLAQAITKDFGSMDAWKKDFIATGMIRGIGWAVLYLDPLEKKLINVWINEHDLGHLAGGTPILIMDVFEHAYMPQYGLDRDKYIDAFFKNIDWGVVSKRFTGGSSNSQAKGSK